jgi:hypothetical protein
MEKPLNNMKIVQLKRKTEVLVRLLIGLNQKLIKWNQQHQLALQNMFTKEYQPLKNIIRLIIIKHIVAEKHIIIEKEYIGVENGQKNIN